MSDDRCKIRLRFRKDGDLRFVSHHDLMRLMERLLRRAAMPLRTSEGFHPKPRIVFAHALALGIEGWDEVVEIELQQHLSPSEVLARLNAAAPTPLVFHDARTVPVRLTGQPERLEYLGRWVDGLPPADLGDRLHRLLAEPTWIVTRVKGSPPPPAPSDEGGEERLDQFAGLLQARPTGPVQPGKLIDVRPFVSQLALSTEGLRFIIRSTPTGSARVDEVLRLLGLWDQFLDGALRLIRTAVVLVDELFGLSAAADAKPCGLSAPAAPPHCKEPT
ncbi:MAG TPA: TIGR03936 family radical SAM-associated protein [Gemmatales bacterium]|nr:TIGR03936 family radical SAM-associated protein [Gemmatales bacterium]HMP59792.1 TIGR03936 family radical SAM-associated protein [Gemmatales bacterium]